MHALKANGSASPSFMSAAEMHGQHAADTEGKREPASGHGNQTARSTEST